MTETDRAKLASDTARQLYRIVGAIDRGELAASATMRAYIEGAVVALDAIASPDPVTELAAMADDLQQM